MRPLAAQRDVTISVSVAPLDVTGDPGPARDLLSNLLGNGIAYDRQRPRVVAIERQGTDAVLRVRDTGIGMTPADRPYVFERFYRGERAREQAPAGAGLGLAMAKWIVDGA